MNRDTPCISYYINLIRFISFSFWLGYYWIFFNECLGFGIWIFSDLFEWYFNVNRISFVGEFCQMVLGMTSSVYSICSITSNNGLTVKNFPNNQSIIIAHLAILFIIFCTIRLLKNKTITNKSNVASGANTMQHQRH